MLTIIQIMLLSISGLFLGYLAFLSLLALAEKKKTTSSAPISKKFAVVIPAYNEAGGITKTVKNLMEVDYPRHLFDVIVIADNCTDQTAVRAENEGAIVWKRHNPDKRGKGHALRWCFDRVLDENDKLKYDSVIVLDADTIVANNMLRVMNDYRTNGAKVIQGYLSVNRKTKAWTSEIIGIGFTLYNYVRPLGRRKLGFSAGLRGNGMCFSTDILKRIPWDSYSLTEDLEYGIKLLLHDVSVVFAPEMIGYSEMPEDSKKAESQRERWEIGRYPVLKAYAGKLLKSGFKNKSAKIFDALIDLITPPLVNMLLFVQLMAGLSFIFWWLGITETLLFVWLWLALLATGLIHAFAGLYAANADRSMYRSLLYVPRYALWKLYVYSKILLKGRSTEWVRTSRD